MSRENAAQQSTIIHLLSARDAAEILGRSPATFNPEPKDGSRPSVSNENAVWPRKNRFFREPLRKRCRNH